jgi:hypothetical protein
MNGSSDRRSFDPWSSPLPDRNADARLLVLGFETWQSASCEGAWRIRRLRQGTAAAREIAENLARCQNGQRCNSSICRICQGRTRIHLIEQAIKLFSADTSPIMVTVVSDQAAVPVGQLNGTKPRRELDRLRQQLSRCGFRGFAIGALDGTYEPDPNAYQIHVHFIASGRDMAPFKRLRELYPSTSTGSAGLFIKSVTDLPTTVSYCLKTYWSERVRFRGTSGRPRSRPPQRLPPRQELEWLEWQGSYSPTSLLFLYGLRRRGNAFERIDEEPRPIHSSYGHRVERTR